MLALIPYNIIYGIILWYNTILICSRCLLFIFFFASEGSFEFSLGTAPSTLCMVLFGLSVVEAVPCLDSGKRNHLSQELWTLDSFMLARTSQHGGAVQTSYHSLDWDPCDLCSFLFGVTLQPSTSCRDLTTWPKELWDYDSDIVLGVHRGSDFRKASLVNRMLLLTTTIFLSQDYMRSVSEIVLIFWFWVMLIHVEDDMNSGLWSTGSLQVTLGKEPLGPLLSVSEYGAASGRRERWWQQKSLPCVLSTQEVPQYLIFICVSVAHW